MTTPTSEGMSNDSHNLIMSQKESLGATKRQTPPASMLMYIKSTYLVTTQECSFHQSFFHLGCQQSTSQRLYTQASGYVLVNHTIDSHCKMESSNEEAQISGCKGWTFALLEYGCSWLVLRIGTVAFSNHPHSDVYFPIEGWNLAILAKVQHDFNNKCPPKTNLHFSPSDTSGGQNTSMCKFARNPAYAPAEK